MSVGMIAGAAISTVGGYFINKSNQKSAEKLQQRAWDAEFAGAQQANEIMNNAFKEASGLIEGGSAKAAAAIMAGAKRQAGAILENTGMAIDTQEKYWAIADKKLEGFRQMGENAGVEMASMLGIPGPDGVMRPYNIDKLRQTPGYEFVFGEGQRATEKSAAGTKLSGEQVKAQTAYGQGMADTYFQRQFGNLNTLYQGGLQAGQTLGGLAVRTGEGIANTYNIRGQQLSGIYGAEASGIANAHMAGAAAQAGALTSVAQSNARLAEMRAGQTASMYENRIGQPSLGTDLARAAVKIGGYAIQKRLNTPKVGTTSSGGGQD